MASEMVLPEASTTPTEYPFAPSPDVLRTHQKDAYITGTLSTQASSILRALLGVRFAHQNSIATNNLTELLYLCLTTLLGNRTLGEEYCDVLQVEDDTLRLAGPGRRLGYIFSVVFTPWILSKSLPALRRKLRLKLEHNISRAQQHLKSKESRNLKVQEYILKNLDTLTSLNSVYALSLASFYFTGSYYHISKRLFGLRYIFTRHLKPNEKRVGYEVLGVLIILQMIVQSTLHIRQTYIEATGAAQHQQPATAVVGPGIEVPLSSNQTDKNTGPDILTDLEFPYAFPNGLSANTSTPILDGARYDLKDDELMSWVPEGQQRKCTLCLEPFRDPSVTTCGHVFCWNCVQDWVKEKAECPLCRQSVLAQKILPLR